MMSHEAGLERLYGSGVQLPYALAPPDSTNRLLEPMKDEVEQLKENVYRVEYRVSSFTSQEQLDAYLRRRCAELTLREGYDFFIWHNGPMCWRFRAEPR